MRRLFPIVALVAAWMLASPLAAQQDTLRHRHAVKVNLISPFLKAPSVSYEYNLSYHSSLQLDLSYIVPRGSDIDAHAMVSQLQYRLYPYRGEVSSFFFAYGINFTQVWSTLNCFIRNDGWDIISRRQTEYAKHLTASGAIGFSLHSRVGLFLEASLGFLFPTGAEVGVSPAMVQNHLSTLWTMRLGYAF